MDKSILNKLTGKRILITGGAGFIGSNLCEFLLENGAKVRCMDNLATGHKTNIDDFIDLPDFHFLSGDIRNIDDCKIAVNGMEYVLHQAALGSVPRSINDPITTNDVNVGGFLNMLVASKDAGIKRFIYAASSSTYGDSEELPKVEQTIGRPLSPYAITKYVNELYADVFFKTYGLDSIGLRYFNVFGKKQDPNGAYAAVIPKFTKAYMNLEPPVIYGDGSFSRDFTYVANVVEMNVRALLTDNSKALNKVYNVAYGERTSLNELADYIRKELCIFDHNIDLIKPVYGDERLGDIPHSLASIERAKGYIGYDINTDRVEDLQKGNDDTLEVSESDLKAVLKSEIDTKKGLFITDNRDHLAQCNYYIITVPTPVDAMHRPVLTALYKSSETVGAFLKKDDIVIYESTVYPGLTEEECVPVLERVSGLTFNKDFFVGYSPERINPGDKKHTVEKILKVTSGSTPEIGKKVDTLYASVIEAGTHLAPTIKVAEAAKVIENSQRDINIAFVNELAKIFNLMHINTQDVLEAAGTKWNFLPFKPGLVGGHCIGVDPYYLAQKAQALGYHPEIILSGRRLNDSMGSYVAAEVVKLMLAKGCKVKGAEVLVLGITFKENCPDIRNTKVIDVVTHLKEFGLNVTVFDPWARPEEVYDEYTIASTQEIPTGNYEGIIHAVAHSAFKEINILKLLGDGGVIYDVKGTLDIEVDATL